MTTIDEQKLEAFMGQVVADAAAAESAAVNYLGDRLGLYRSMADAGPLTSRQLAHRTGLAERYVREWLANQVAGGYVTYDSEDATFELPDEHALVLADEGSDVFVAGMFEIIAAMWAATDQVGDAFRTGDGVGCGHRRQLDARKHGEQDAAGNHERQGRGAPTALAGLVQVAADGDERHRDQRGGDGHGDVRHPPQRGVGGHGPAQLGTVERVGEERVGNQPGRQHDGAAATRTARTPVDAVSVCRMALPLLVDRGSPLVPSRDGAVSAVASRQRPKSA